MAFRISIHGVNKIILGAARSFESPKGSGRTVSTREVIFCLDDGTEQRIDLFTDGLSPMIPAIMTNEVGYCRECHKKLPIPRDERINTCSACEVDGAEERYAGLVD